MGIADLVASSDPHETLTAVGLGSCVAVVLLGRIPGARTAAGLAHVLLPTRNSAPPGAPAPPGKYGDVAVAALLDRMLDEGVSRRSVRAVLVGGAKMFELMAGADVGHRNLAVTERELQGLRIPVIGRATGGQRGRTVRVPVGEGSVLVRESRGSGYERVGGLRQKAAGARGEV